MAETTLVEKDVQAGAELIRALDKDGLNPVAALWYYLPESQQWMLVLASTLVDEKGTTETYRMIQKSLSRLQDAGDMSLDNIRVVSPNDSLIKLLQTALKTVPGIHGIRFSRNAINGIFIDDAYIYRLC